MFLSVRRRDIQVGFAFRAAIVDSSTTFADE